MPLKFQPRPGSVVFCDFRGYELPEMVKIRPVVVLARNSRNRELVTVVPLSTTAPKPPGPHHHEMPSPLPGKAATRCWAKGDMVATVSLARLDRVKVAHRVYATPELDPADWQAIRRAVAVGLGLAHI